jgi:hypothetical protein
VLNTQIDYKDHIWEADSLSEGDHVTDMAASWSSYHNLLTAGV